MSLKAFFSCILFTLLSFNPFNINAQCAICDDYAEAIKKPSKVSMLQLNGASAVLDEKIGEMKNLQVLALTNAQLSSFPASISNLKRLTDVSFQGSNLSDLPEFLYEIESLKIINLSGNPIDTATLQEIRKKMKSKNPYTRIDF